MTEIDFKLEPADLASYQLASRDRLASQVSKSLWDDEIVRTLLVILVAAATMIAVEAVARAALGRSLMVVDYALGALLGAVLMLGLVWLHYFDQRRRLTRPDGPVRGRSNLRLTREGVVITQRDVETRYGWRVFIDVTEARSLVLMWVEPGVAVAVPFRAFASDKARADFILEAKARMSEASLPRVGSFG